MLTGRWIVVELVDLAAQHPGWEQALPVLRELRPHLTAQGLQQVLREGAPQGLRFLGVFDDDGRCLAVAGWRIVANTSAGRKLYVDDLVTSSASRSTGVGALLLEELRGRAEGAGCTVLALDSGVQRTAAHRFYLRERMAINAFHFTTSLSVAEQ
jgi:GNAT superfamily N-acetyltransferase